MGAKLLVGCISALFSNLVGRLLHQLVALFIELNVVWINFAWFSVIQFGGRLVLLPWVKGSAFD